MMTSSSPSKSPPSQAVVKGDAATNRHDGDNDEKTTEIWFKEEERWELTWPIWHMLPRDERKALAIKHGYKTIGEFEEYMTLQRGITDSSTTAAQRPYENNLVYPEYHHPTTTTAADADQKMHAKPTKPDEAEDVESEDEELEEKIRKQQAAAEEQLSTDELVRVGGKILILPDELLHKVFAWLPVDTYATLALVSPHWKAFTRTEAVYRRLCERLYLVQSQRKALHVHRFNNSYRTMLEKRPRVRAGGGVYVMKYTKVKPVQRDMWTEVRAWKRTRRVGYIDAVGAATLCLGKCSSCFWCALVVVLPTNKDSRGCHFRNGLLPIPVLPRRWPGLVRPHFDGSARNVSTIAQNVSPRNGIH